MGEQLPPRLDDWPEEWREAYEERAAIMEFDGGLAQPEAERAAWECIQHIYLEKQGG